MSAGCGLSALRLVPVPETGPPFDGEPPADAIAADGGAPADIQSNAGVRGGVQSNNGACGAGPAGSRAEDEWSRQFALLLTEALAGARPLRQLLPWTTERARGHLDKLTPLFSGGQRPRVQRVITNRPTRDAIEMTLVVGVGTRTRAIAVRLERARRTRQSQWPNAAARPGAAGRTAAQWLCTDIEAA